MADSRGLCGLLAVVLCGCGTTGGPGPARSPVPPSAPDCRVARATGDVAAVRRATGEIVVVGGGVELLRSVDGGVSWRREALPATCRWPDIAEVGDRLLVSCSEPKPPGRLLVLAERPDGSWPAPVAVDTTAELVIDTRLQRLAGGEVVLFATHVDRRDDLDDAVFTIVAYRSEDDGASWSAGLPVAAGRRGEHLEDTRSVVLADGTLLLAWEHEPVEGGPSRVVQSRSPDSGSSWSRPESVWSGGDVEPGGYLQFADGELWFIASSDERAGGGSYDRATILTRRSADGGLTWSAPEVLVDRENQISFGGVVLPGDEVMLPSLRYYSDRRRRQLSLYVVRRDGSSPARCAAEPMSRVDFEGGLDPQLERR